MKKFIICTGQQNYHEAVRPVCFFKTRAAGHAAAGRYSHGRTHGIFFRTSRQRKEKGIALLFGIFIVRT